MVRPQSGSAIENGRAALGSEAVLVGVAAYAGDSFQSEVEEFGFEAGLVQEGNEEGAETAIYVQWDLLLQR